MKKLPDTEFEIMKVMWDIEPPITTRIIKETIGNQKDWKGPTVISFLNRLIEKGFVRTEKNGKERMYFPIIMKEEYLKFESENFIKNYHANSFFSLVGSLYDGKKMTNDEIEELEMIIKRGREQND